MSRLATAVVAALLLALTACGSDDGGSGSSPGSTSSPASESGSVGGDAVAWAEKVCKSVESEVDALSQTPDIDPSSPQKAKDGMVTYLDGLATAIDRMIGGIKSAGTPPVDNGQETVDETTTGLEEAQKTIKDAKTTIEQAPVDDPAAFQQAFTKAGQDLQALSNLDSLEAMEQNTELKDAFDQAETCQKLEGGSSNSAPTS